MQVHQRMEVDHEELNAFNPRKPTLNQNQNANIPPLEKNSKFSQQKIKKNRVFGQDITNKTRVNQINKNNHNKLNKNDAFRVSKHNQQPLKVEVIPRSKSESCISQPDQFTSLKNNKSMDDIQEIEEEIELNNIKDEDGDNLMKNDDFEEVIPAALYSWDKKDINNDLAVTDYVNEIINSLREDEIKYQSIENNDFMSHQKDVNPRMRLVLIDWLIEVHRKFKLLPATYYLAVNLIDRYLSKAQIDRHELQLTGCTCLWIASKYHEIYAPEMDDFVYISDNAFTDNELMKMEIKILKELDFNLTIPTVLSFKERYVKVAEHYLKKEKEVKIISYLMSYLIEHCVVSYDLCRYYPSKIAAAAFAYSCIATKVFSINTYKSDNLKQVSGYSIEELTEICQKIDYVVKMVKKSKYKAVYKKYSSTTYHTIAKLNFYKLDTSWLYANTPNKQQPKK